MKKKELLKDYKFFQIKRKFNKEGKQFHYVEYQDRVEFIFLHKGEVYWRSEYNPAHSNSLEEINYYPYSTTIEEDEVPIQAVKRKVEEEVGFAIEKMNILYKKHLFESKHVASRVYLFIIELLEIREVEKRTDRIFWKSFGKNYHSSIDSFINSEISSPAIEHSLSLELLANKLKDL